MMSMTATTACHAGAVRAPSAIADVGGGLGAKRTCTALPSKTLRSRRATVAMVGNAAGISAVAIGTGRGASEGGEARGVRRRQRSGR